MLRDIIAWCVNSFGQLFSFLFGQCSVYFKVLVCFMVIDYISGVMGGYANKKLSSSIGIKGIFKKISILICVIVAVQIDTIMGTTFLRLACILCLISNEGISITENLAQLGVPIPHSIVDALEQLKNKDQKEIAETNKGKRT